MCYYHILLSEHDVIFAENVASESLFLGPMALKGISRKDRKEISDLFPGISNKFGSGLADHMRLARPTIPQKMLKNRGIPGLSGARTQTVLKFAS